MRVTASSREISPSSTIATAVFSAAAAVRFAAARLEQEELLLLDRELDVLHVAVVALEHGDRLDELVERLGQRSRISASGSGVRMPATTSSPCAFGRNSP